LFSREDSQPASPHWLDLDYKRDMKSKHVDLIELVVVVAIVAIVVIVVIVVIHSLFAD